jgi:GT2 family glycosyltransferase/glycosyltransferase involved in cell wall biosynthesis
MSSGAIPGDASAEHLLALVVDPIWYRARYRDVGARGVDPLRHFIDHGIRERRDPNRWFDGAWYLRQYADAAASGAHPLLHYMSEGAGKRRDPHPRFDAGWYVEEHPEAAGNPLLFHVRVGAARGWLTERPVAIEDYLPSTRPRLPDPEAVLVDTIVPVYRGLATTRACLRSVLADTARPPGRIVVVDDASPEPKLVAWLDRLAKTGAIELIRNERNLGFVASVNLGMIRAGDRDVVLLNSDTEVPPGWLRRLRAQAYAGPRIASVSPLSNNATICSYVDYEGGPIPAGMTPAGIDAACQAANAGRSVPTPTTVGFCMYIRRAALAETGLFDEETFGRGYGEENDFCLRAAALGWTHRIACDTFVSHRGGASFGSETDARIESAYAVLTARFPQYPAAIARHARDSENAPFRFAVTMSLFRTSGSPTILLISHALDGGVRRHVRDIVDGRADDRVDGRADDGAHGRADDAGHGPVSGGAHRRVDDHAHRRADDAGQGRADGRVDDAAHRRGKNSIEHRRKSANYLLLYPARRGVALSVPALPGHPELVLAPERWRDLAAVARSAGVSRVHIHHLMGLDLDVRALIHELGVPFDVAVHDYFAICPQVTLLPWSGGSFCGEPGPDGCDACIANRPSHGATDILSWRLRWAWQFREASRVVAPSMDTLERLRRHGLGANGQYIPLEPPSRPAGTWPLRPPSRPGKQLRVAVLGVLANHKGAHVVASVAMAADPAMLSIQSIGYTEPGFPEAARTRMRISGPYREGQLPALLARYRPHVVWFPVAWPETYSFTLSAAIESGLPIVASGIGALPERLVGRPLTWVIPPSMDPTAWLNVFRMVAASLRMPRAAGSGAAGSGAAGSGAAGAGLAGAGGAGSRVAGAAVAESRVAGAAVAESGMAGSGMRALRDRVARAVPVRADCRDGASPSAEVMAASAPRPVPVAQATAAPTAIDRTRRPRATLVDLRRDGAIAVVVIPETFDDGSFTPCAQIRLLRPLDHPAAGQGLETTLADAQTACRYRADIIVTQRHAVPSIAAAEALAAHARSTRATLIYDLDDDLSNVPADHPEAADLAPNAELVARSIRLADVVRTSTAVLAERIAPFARRVQVVGNALDERIWLPRMRDRHDIHRPVRILCMGTATHDADFALILPALMEIDRQFGDHARIDLIGFVSNLELPGCIRRLAPSVHASRSYAGFVQWLSRSGPWDIGLAPLADSSFNACKSAIKALDYAALGLATVASDVAAYRGSVADGPGGTLVTNTTDAWYQALSRLIRDGEARARLAEGGIRRLLADGTLASRAASLANAWRDARLRPPDRHREPSNRPAADRS